MKRILCAFLALFTFALCAPPPAQAAESGRIVRVGLYYSASTLSSVTLEGSGGFALGSMEDTTFSEQSRTASTALTVTADGSRFTVTDAAGNTVYQAEGDTLAVRSQSGLTECKEYTYRGDFVLRQDASGKLTVLNYVALEDYVKGVLPYEMSASWPAEALKAQAICARSFALGSLNKHKSLGFELCNTTNCQVYRGIERATAASDAAVDATAGQILMYDGKLAVGYFFSSDGGATEDNENVWGGDPVPYLRGVPDPYEDSKSASNGTWSVTLTADEIASKLRASGRTIGTVANVQVTKRTNMDNVNEVTVTDTAGKTVVLKNSAVRSVFGLNSIRYTITPNAGKSAAAEISTRSNPDALSILPSTHKVAVDGKSAKPQGYLVNQENYFKLRDIAYILKDTKACFAVDWDAANKAIRLTSGKTYQPTGGELASGTTAVESSAPSDDKITLNGKPAALSGYRINDNNYYRVRDLAELIGFGIDFDSATRTVQIVSDASSEDPEGGNPVTPSAPPTAYTFTGTGWGHNVGMSQYGAKAMAQQGFTYDEILKYYFTGITISES